MQAGQPNDCVGKGYPGCEARTDSGLRLVQVTVVRVRRAQRRVVVPSVAVCLLWLLGVCSVSEVSKVRQVRPRRRASVRSRCFLRAAATGLTCSKPATATHASYTRSKKKCNQRTRSQGRAETTLRSAKLRRSEARLCEVARWCPAEAVRGSLDPRPCSPNPVRASRGHCL